MTAHQKSESGKQRAGTRQRQGSGDRPPEEGRTLLSRRELAVALGVSLRTLERMLHDKEIEPVRMHGWSVRFDLEEVRCELKENEATRKHGRKAGLATESAETTKGAGAERSHISDSTFETRQQAQGTERTQGS